jgi:hypothetical protein
MLLSVTLSQSENLTHHLQLLAPKFRRRLREYLTRESAKWALEFRAHCCIMQGEFWKWVPIAQTDPLVVDQRNSNPRPPPPASNSAVPNRNGSQHRQQIALPVLLGGKKWQ